MNTYVNEKRGFDARSFFKKYGLWIILGIILIMAGAKYNSIVSAEEEVFEKWANVETAYQRRADLIPNLVSVAKKYADFEKSTLESVVQARAQATSVNVDAGDLTPEKMQQFQQAQQQLGGALSKLLVTVERYPDLKANQNFHELMVELEGTENRIKRERDQYNQAVKDFNKQIRRFPGNMYNMIYGFEKKAPFEAEEGAENAVDVGEQFEE